MNLIALVIVVITAEFADKLAINSRLETLIKNKNQAYLHARA